MFDIVSVCVLISIICPWFWPVIPEGFQASVRPLPSSDPSEANKAAKGAKSTKAQNNVQQQAEQVSSLQQASAATIDADYELQQDVNCAESAEQSDQSEQHGTAASEGALELQTKIVEQQLVWLQTEQRYATMAYVLSKTEGELKAASSKAHKPEEQAAEDRTMRLEIQGQLQEAELQLTGYNSSHAELQHKLEQAELQLGTETNRKLALQKQLEHVKQQLAASQSSCAELQRKLEQAEQQLGTETNSKLELQKQLEQTEEQLASEQGSMAAIQEKPWQAEEKSRLHASSKAEAQAEAQEAQQWRETEAFLRWEKNVLCVSSQGVIDRHYQECTLLEEYKTKVQQRAQQQLQELANSKPHLQHQLEEAHQLLKLEQDKAEQHRRQGELLSKSLQFEAGEVACLPCTYEQLRQEVIELEHDHTVLQKTSLDELAAQHGTLSKLQQQLQEAQRQSNEVHSSKAELQTKLDDMHNSLLISTANDHGLSQSSNGTHATLPEDDNAVEVFVHKDLLH